jgi:hypothetical protein
MSFVITMLDGDLGAVTDPDSALVQPTLEADCWCGCSVCLDGPTTLNYEEVTAG